MSTWSGPAVTSALGLAAREDDLAMTYRAVSTDTRKLAAGDLFVALRGESHDGHEYLTAAREAGAPGAVVDTVPEDAPSDMHYYVVADTLAALGRLARCRRRLLGVRVCAVAGSNGKTTTKDLLRAALSPQFDVHATRGNFNNLVGAPLTLLAAPDTAAVVVAEIGTNAPGEIARLAAIVEPDAAVITGISAEHLEGLGDLDGVLREETAVLPWVPRTGTIVVADDPPTLAVRARALHPSVRVAGLSDEADEDLRGTAVQLDEEGRVRFHWAGHDVALELRGRHNARNALLALGVARDWGVDASDAVAALRSLQPPKLRTEVLRIGDLVVIADCYNANPASVLAAVDLLASMPRRGGRIVVLGSMLELGPDSAAIHAQVARDVAAAGEFDVVVATGEFASAFEAQRDRLGRRLIVAADPDDVFEPLVERMSGDEVILLKGSRGVALERLLPRFEEQWGLLHPHGEASGSRATGKRTGSRDDARPAEHPQQSRAGTTPADRRDR